MVDFLQTYRILCVYKKQPLNGGLLDGGSPKSSKFFDHFPAKNSKTTALTWRYHLKNSGRDLGQLAALASALQSPGTASGAVGSRVERGVPWFIGSKDLQFFSG